MSSIPIELFALPTQFLTILLPRATTQRHLRQITSHRLDQVGVVFAHGGFLFQFPKLDHAVAGEFLDVANLLFSLFQCFCFRLRTRNVSTGWQYEGDEMGTVPLRLSRFRGWTIL